MGFIRHGGLRHPHITTISSTRPATVTAHATVHTKGTAAALGTAEFPFHGLVVSGIMSGIGNRLIDILIDDQVVIPNLFFGGYASSTADNRHYYFPIYVKKGAVITAQAQADVSSLVTYVGVRGLTVNFDFQPSLSLVEAVGANTGTSKGTQVDPGGTTHTKGATSSLGTLTRAARQLVIAAGPNNNTDKNVSNRWNVDISIAASPSGNDIVVGDWLVFTTGYNCLVADLSSFPCGLPAGTTLYTRAAASMTGSSSRLIDIVCYGVS